MSFDGQFKLFNYYKWKSIATKINVSQFIFVEGMYTKVLGLASNSLDNLLHVSFMLSTSSLVYLLPK